MALPAPTPEDVRLVMDITGFHDRHMITSALKAKSNNVEAVMNEYFDSPEKFKGTYGWNEAVFSSSREGEDAPASTTGNPSFVIHPADSQVIYGADPTAGFYGPIAPSRPPSRTNNRSPMSRVVEMSAGDFSSNAPNNQQEEDALLQQAINESLQTSGVQSPQHLPPPPPHPQQSGVTSSDNTPVYFGPANRSDYNPDEWAMVTLKGRDADPAPAQRKRNPDAPVFLRCRNEDEWKKHRVGGILTILHSIPAARNALLRTGRQPDYGYGSNAGWWKGEMILPPEKQAAKDAEQGDVWATEIYPPWTDELHRLLAFLDSTERSYGSADIVAESRSTTEISGDRERDFFEEIMNDPQGSVLFSSSVDIVSVLGDTTYSNSGFTILDTQVLKDALLMAENLYNVWDMIFYADANVSNEDLEESRMAMITHPSDVIVFRFAGDSLPHVIDIPEIFYIDRYLAAHRDEMRQLQFDMSVVAADFQKSQLAEQNLTQWRNPQNNKTFDRRAMNATAIKRCQEIIAHIKNRGFWRKHEAARQRGDDQDFYLPEHAGDPELLPEEAGLVAFYENKIPELEENTREIERVMNDVILPERKTLEMRSRHLGALLTGPSEETKWNATHKYTLRGVVSDPNRVFVRKRETSLIEMDENATPGEQWWRLSCDPDNNHTVSSDLVSFELAMRETCVVGSKPILIYATDRAMEDTPEPLSDALKTFVKFDNRHFKQELSFAEQQQPTEQTDMSYRSTLRAAGMKTKRSDSMDSMATNQASAGDFDDDMRDAPFEQDEGFVDGTANDGGFTIDQETSELVDVSVGEDVHSERLARVSLDDVDNRKLPPPAQDMPEMRERANSPLITRPASGIFMVDRNGISPVDEGELAKD